MHYVLIATYYILHFLILAPKVWPSGKTFPRNRYKIVTNCIPHIFCWASSSKLGHKSFDEITQWHCQFQQVTLCTQILKAACVH